MYKELELEVNELGLYGLASDVAPYMLPPESLTTAHNIRHIDGAVREIDGQLQILGTPGTPPHFLMGIMSNVSEFWWLYTSLTKAYVTDGTTHTDITRTSGGDYTAGDTRDWNGTVIGGIPILNNGADLPQYWSSYNPATKLTTLPNWPSTHRAKLFRTFGPYLVAFSITKSGTVYPHMVKWSHPADPGTIPISWDETDPTRDAGEKELNDAENGLILDAMMYRNTMYVYKESSIWAMRLIGHPFIFDFQLITDGAGLLAERCVANVPLRGVQSFVGRDDWYIHDGSMPVSILDGRQRKALFAEIDDTNYRNSFLFNNPMHNELWFCYPTQGNAQPNKALVWNYSRTGTPGAFSTADVNFRNVAVGPVEDVGGDTWEADDDTWEANDQIWDPTGRRTLVACVPDLEMLVALDVGSLHQGDPIEAIIQRQSLSVVGRTRSGAPIVDIKKVKTIRRVWVKLSGGPVQMRLGAQLEQQDPMVWTDYITIGETTRWTSDLIATGRFLAYEIKSLDNGPWRVEGLKFEITIGGDF